MEFYLPVRGTSYTPRVLPVLANLQLQGGGADPIWSLGEVVVLDTQVVSFNGSCGTGECANTSFKYRKPEYN